MLLGLHLLLNLELSLAFGSCTLRLGKIQNEVSFIPTLLTTQLKEVESTKKLNIKHLMKDYLVL
jgi:hypothetical protein